MFFLTTDLNQMGSDPEHHHSLYGFLQLLPLTNIYSSFSRWFVSHLLFWDIVGSPKSLAWAPHAYPAEERIPGEGMCLPRYLSISVDYKFLKVKDCVLFIIVSLAYTGCSIKHLVNEQKFLNVHTMTKS